MIEYRDEFGLCGSDYAKIEKAFKMDQGCEIYTVLSGRCICSTCKFVRTYGDEEPCCLCKHCGYNRDAKEDFYKFKDWKKEFEKLLGREIIIEED